MSSLPNKLKLFELFVNGFSLGKKAKNVTLPTLTRTMEDFRGGSMSGSVAIDLGNEPMELSFTCSGAEFDLIKHYAAKTVNTTMFRFAAAYQCDDTASTNSVDIVVRGRIKELNFGSQETGALGETSVTVACTYYKLTKNGVILAELDPLNCIEIINGTDMLSEAKAALGMAISGIGF